jgi:hypothetical protein
VQAVLGKERVEPVGLGNRPRFDGGERPPPTQDLSPLGGPESNWDLCRSRGSAWEGRELPVKRDRKMLGLFVRYASTTKSTHLAGRIAQTLWACGLPLGSLEQLGGLLRVGHLGLLARGRRPGRLRVGLILGLGIS